jgi:hypothetical protein
MKKILSLIFIVMISALAIAEKGKDAVDSELNTGNPVVLVLGLENGDLISNYYMHTDIAERTGIKEDSIEAAYTSTLLSKLNENNKARLNFVPCEQPFSVATQESVNTLLNKWDADYLLHINQYEINWMGEPYYTLHHIVNYELLNAKSRKLYSGKTSFSTAELVPLKALDKKHDKIAKKIVKQTLKATK